MYIDPTIINDLLTIALSVAANGLTSLIAKSSHKVEELIIGKESTERQKLEETALKPILLEAVNNVGDHLHELDTESAEVISSFLRSPEVEEIIRQIYSTDLVEDEKLNDISSIRTIFLTLYTQYIVTSRPDLTAEIAKFDIIAPPLFDALIKGCNILLNAAVDKGILAAHEAKEVFRYNILQSQVTAIQRELELLSMSHKIDRNAILEFEKQYRMQVGQRHSHITPPNLEAARPRPIDKLYVYPKFIMASKLKEGSKSQVIDKNSFLSIIYRGVLLGNPGGGKSTLTLKICYDLANHYSQRMIAGRKELTPILVVLRNYGAEKKERKCSILEFIEAEVKSTYQLPTPPHNAFQYLLLTGRTMVIFDGLDELLDTSYRQEIRDDVESFCHLYPSVPVLVTSREVGYEQAPLDEGMFQVFHLNQFDNVQVEEYVKKWFDVADEGILTTKQRQSKAEAFLKESTIVPDLRINPLMLALLCSIYHEENYIPRYRPDVYEKCALMLFERWDKTRSIYSPPLPEEHVRPLLEYIANWIYEDEQLRAGITEEELATKATAYLNEWIYENIHKAERTAYEFIKFCTGRAWVFTDTGTRKKGEKLFQFTHTTFLEYFAAAHLVRTCRTPDTLLEVLIPRIAKREWDVMAQLAFQLQNKKNVGAGDELLLTLIEQSHKNTSDEGWNLLSFASRCLQFIVPRPRVRRYLVTEIVERYLARRDEKQPEAKQKIARDDLDNRDQLYPKNLFDDLLPAVPENRATIADTLRELLVEKLNSDKESVVLAAFEITTYLFWRWGSDQDIWQSLSDYIFNTCSNQLQVLYPKIFLVCVDAVWRERIQISDVVKWHGIESLLSRAQYILFDGLNFSSFLATMIRFIMEWEVREVVRSGALSMISDLGNTLLSYSLPWFNQKPDDLQIASFIHFKHKKDLSEIMKDLDHETIFGIFVLLAIGLEMDDKKSQPFRKILEQSPEELYHLPLKRFSKQKNKTIVEKEIDNYEFTKEQQQFILSWVHEEINLVD